MSSLKTIITWLLLLLVKARGGQRFLAAGRCKLKLELYQADRTTLIGPLVNDMIIDIAKTPRVNIRASAFSGFQSLRVSKISFYLDDTFVRTDRLLPTWMIADEDGTWTPTVGTLKISITGSYRLGGKLRSMVRVIVVDSTAKVPVASPVQAPMETPVKAPMALPVQAPVVSPVQAPAVSPVQAPMVAPSAAIPAPVQAPVVSPVQAPMLTPSAANPAPATAPVVPPSKAPTTAPSKAPTTAPSKAPTKAPSKAPTKAPSKAPTKAPSKAPTKAPAYVGVPIPFYMRAGPDAYNTSDSIMWVSDVPYVTGGQMATDVSSGQGIGNTIEDGLYRRQRFDYFSYRIPMATGLYRIRMHHTETL
jgi:hypothetical protein